MLKILKININKYNKQDLIFLLFLLYPYAQFWNENFHEDIYSMFGIYIFMGNSFILYLFYRLFEGKIDKKNLLFFIVSCLLFYNYNTIKEFLSYFDILSYEGIYPRRRYVVPLYLSLFIISFWLCRAHYEKFKNFLRYFSVTLMIFPLTSIGYKAMDVVWKKVNSKERVLSNETLKFFSKPNVYFFLIDGYPRQDALFSYANYDNSSFISRMKEIGFRSFENSYANYPCTRVSVPSTLDMNYMVDPKGNCVTKCRLSGNCQIVKTLKSAGYKFILAPYSRSYCVGHEDMCIANTFLENPTILFNILKLTPLYEILENTPLFNRGTFLGQLGEGELSIEELGEFIENLDYKKTSPLFIYYHNMDVHDFRYISDKCERTTLNRDILTRLASHGNATRYELEKIYTLNSVRCVNKDLYNLVDKIIKKDPEAIIIIQSDHGIFPESLELYYEFDKWSEELKKQKFGILNLIRVPESLKNKIEFYEEITPVNTFRVILNSFIDKKFEILPDLSYYVSDFDFIKNRGADIKFWRTHK